MKTLIISNKAGRALAEIGLFAKWFVVIHCLLALWVRWYWYTETSYTGIIVVHVVGYLCALAVRRAGHFLVDKTGEYAKAASKEGGESPPTLPANPIPPAGESRWEKIKSVRSKA